MYKQAHAELCEKLNELTNEEKYSLCKTIYSNWNENQLIWKELKYYQTNQKILCEHPIFHERKIEKNIRDLTKIQQINKLNSLKHSIWRNEKKQLTQAIENRLNRKRLELKILSKVINE